MEFVFLYKVILTTAVFTNEIISLLGVYLNHFPLNALSNLFSFHFRIC